MTRTQSVLLTVLLALAALVIGRMAGPALVPLAGTVRGALADSLAAVPTWVWWTVAGSLWWLPWMGRGCGRSACGARTVS